MSENTTPEVIEGECVSEETPKVKLIDRIGRKGKIALGAVGAMAITAIAGSFVKNEIYGSVTDAFGDVLEEWSQDDESVEDEEEDEDTEDSEEE